MTDDIVRTVGDYLIIHHRRLFADGFNVYRNDHDGTATKVNDPLSWFGSQQAAEDWIEEHCT